MSNISTIPASNSSNPRKRMQNPNQSQIVYGKALEDLVDTLTDGSSTDLKVASASVDSISEATSGSGVTITGQLEPIEDVTATNVITAAESGSTFFLNSATEFVSTLPAPAAGLKYKFIVKAAPSGANYTIVTNGGDNILIGMVTCATADDLGAVDANADVITFVGGQSVVGDWVEVVSDGTSWYYSGACFVAEGITTGTT